MNYLLDKKHRRQKWMKRGALIIVLGVLIYFHAGIYNGLSAAAQGIFRPIFSWGSSVGVMARNTASFFSSKRSLQAENDSLASQLSALNARLANYDSLLAENERIEAILGRKDATKDMLLSAVLAKPSNSPYDTLLIDAGTDQGIRIGSVVFAAGDIPIGRIADVSVHSSKVVLFSSPGEKTQVNITLDKAGDNSTVATDMPLGAEVDMLLSLIGRGGSNFELTLPRDLTIAVGAQATLPGIRPYLIGTVKSILSDPRDAFTKALLASPVNVQELRFVQVER